ncbi:MAG: L,D-transpeptidase [Polyangiaceae bacterium]|nr:L,D-transpeptidase [Polyangiaceae bacterium]
MQPHRPALALALPLLLAPSGCDNKLELSGTAAAAVRSAEASQLVGPEAQWDSIPVPPANGPKLAPLSLVAKVYPKPDKRSDSIGYLRVGARVARSAAPVSKDACPEGWFAIRPVGFVCAGQDATTKLDHPILRAFHVEPNRRKPMPYHYGFARSIAPNYLRVPTKAEQFQYEMRLERHLRNYQKLAYKWDALDVGANDVPLGASGAAGGQIPEHAIPMDMNERYGGHGDDSVPWWLVGERRVPNISSFTAPGYAVIASRVKRHAGVAFIGTFVAGEQAQNRRFAIATDGRLLPADKIKADSGSPFHGTEIREIGLPLAFAFAPRAHSYRLVNGALERDQPLGRRELVALSGTVREIGGVRIAQTRNGSWVKSSEVRTAAKPNAPPAWARRGVRWIDISIQNQTLVLWEGVQPVYATLVSTGRGGLGEPGKTLSTPTGMYRIYQKHVTTTMDSSAADSEFELRDVPWVMYFKGGYALHGAYWHDDFGKVRSHGCVNMSPIDARYAFFWSLPQVPEHWHAAFSGDSFEEGTLVYIHP